MQARDILASTPFFTDVFSSGELDALAARLKPAHFPRGAVLMREGDLGDSMFILVDGKVAVSIHAPGGDQDVATLGSGDIVGEMSLMTGSRRSATVTAAGRVVALEIAKPALEALLAGKSELLRRFAETVEQRHAELDSIHREAARWYSTGRDQRGLVGMMTDYYGH